MLVTGDQKRKGPGWRTGEATVGKEGSKHDEKRPTNRGGRAKRKGGGMRKEMKTQEESKKDSNRGERKEKSRARKGGKSEGRGGHKKEEERATRTDFSPQSSGSIRCIFMTLPESE